MRGGVHLSSYYGQRLARILPAYWLVVGAYSLWLRWQGRISLTVAAWSMSTLHYWFHITGSFNWYVPALLAFYGLSPFYERLFARCGRKEWLTAAAFPAAYGLYRLSILPGLHYTEDFVNRIPAVALGFLMGHYVRTDRALTKRHMAVWAALAAAGIAVTWLRVQGRLYISPCYCIAAVLIPLCLLLGKLLDRLPWKRVHAGLRMLGECSLEIYLLNVVITREFDVLSLWFDRDSRHITYYLTVYTLNILAAVLLHRGVETVKRTVRKTKV